MRTPLVPLVAILALSPTVHAARTVAIAYFDNDTGKAEYDPLRKGMADMLITDLAQVSSLQIVEREKLNAVIDELKLSKSKFIDPKTAQKLGKGLAAEYIMTGSMNVAGDTMRVDARIVQVKTGTVAATEKVDGKKDEFFALEKELVDTLVKTLDLKLSLAEKGKLRTNATQSFEAFAKYSQGLDAKDHGNDDKARELFQAALDADPNYKAAKTATERLRVIFSRSEAQHNAAVDEMLKHLDPKAPDFGQKINDTLQQLRDQSDATQMKQKVALLTWIAENDYLVTGQMGYSAVVGEGLGLLNRYLQDPDEWDTIPQVCEYFITKYPKDQMAQPQCKVYLKVIDAMRTAYSKQGDKGLQMLRDNWKKNRETASLDWEKILTELDPQIRKLFAIYARKVKHH